MTVEKQQLIVSIVALFISVINTASIVVLVYQFILEKRSYIANREEKIREKTVEVIHQWTIELSPISKFLETLINDFDEKTCKKIYEYESIKVNDSVKNQICQICKVTNPTSENGITSKDGKWIIGGVVLSELRWNITKYLNSLEVVAVAWQQGLVDRAVVEDQFSFLVRDGKNAMQKYRKIAGNGHSYPALDSFCKAIQKRYETHHPSSEPKNTMN